MDAYLVETILGEHGAVDWRHGAWGMNYWGLEGWKHLFFSQARRGSYLPFYA